MGKGVFEGLRLAELAWVATVPLVGRYFAMHGATVIKIESGTAGRGGQRGASMNRSPLYFLTNNDKYSITLNLKHPKGLETARRLIASCDIFTEAFTPGTVDRLGIGYEELKKLKPDLIMLSQAMFGRTGPNSTHPGYGTELQSLAGFTNLLGFPDGNPQIPHVAYTDYFAFDVATWILIAALEHRRQTGEGMYIDLSQYECSLQFLSPLLLDYFANNHSANRTGNRSIYSGGAPEGAYRCSGDDRWCVISVTTDKEWETFCRVLGNPEWTKDQRFSTFLGRHEHADELDSLITKWTTTRSAEEVMKLLQSAGVDAGVVQNEQDISMDPQFIHRQHFARLPHMEIGESQHQLPAFRLSKTPAAPERSAPCLGEHTQLVCTQVLGMSDEEFASLQKEGVFE